MAKNKAGTQTTPQMSPEELNAVTRLVSHTARMQAAVVQSPSGQTAEDRGYDAVIASYKPRWSGLSPEQQKAAKEAAGTLPDLSPSAIKAAVAALEE